MENEQDRFYDDNNESRQPYVKKTFDEKNYLNTRLDKGETKREVRIRILPASPDTKKIYTPIHIHSLKLDTEIAKSGFKSFICLNDEHLDHHDDRGCPICNKSKQLFEEANQCDKDHEAERKALCKEAFKYVAKDCYIVRCIERGKESEGVKFWRFNKWDNGNGCLDKLKNLWTTRNNEAKAAGLDGYDIFDLEHGRDLILTLTKSTRNDNSEKTEISIMEAGFETPLSTDPAQVEAWVNDEKSWRDLYSVKTFEYLDIVVAGGIPWYDKEKGIYVPKEVKEKDDANFEEKMRQELQNAGTVSEPQGETATDDLPF